MKKTQKIKKRAGKAGDGSLVMKFKPIEKTIKRAVKRPEITVDESFKIKWEELELPDSEATVEKIKAYDGFTWEQEPINYWKYACIAILLGLVAGMIISTPFIINAVEVCSQ